MRETIRPNAESRALEKTSEPETVIDERYRVISQLGEGSSAKTLLVERLEDSERFAAKELRAEHLESWKHFELFEREAKTLRGLRHHGIPEVHDFFEVDDGGRTRLYLVQEWIEGASLRETIDERRAIGPALRDKLVLGLLDILDYLHGQSPPIFHRDIKPSNIVIRPSGSPVLIDFGGVCDGWRAPNEGGSTIIGTHGYAPPEQYLGQASPSSDLYALGACLLHLIGGRSPSEYDFSSGRIEVPPKLPCTPGLRTLIERCLAPAPRDRPQSADEARSLLLPTSDDGSSLSSGVVAQPKRVFGTGNARMDEVRRILALLGEPPRGRTPENRNLYQTLMPPIARGAIGWLALLGMTFLTVGVMPLVSLGQFYSRKRRFEWLFHHGATAVGEVRNVTGQGQTVHRGLVYEFDVNGRGYRGLTQFFGPEVQMFGGGDPIVVLFDPSDPELNTAIYASKQSSLLGGSHTDTKRLNRAKLRQIGTDLPS